MPDRVAVSSADFVRNIGYWQGEALRRPISITHHGRERLVLATPDRFEIESGGISAGAAEAMSAQRADSTAILSNCDDGYFAFDSKQQITDCNPMGEAFTGRAARDLQGMTALEVLPQPLASIVHDRVARVLRARKPERFEASAFDGRRIEVCVFPLHEGAAALFHNTTEIHALRRELERVRALDAAVNAHSRTAAIRLDGRARIEEVDDLFCRLSGFRREDVHGHRFLDLTAPMQRREVGELIERVLREGVTSEMALTLVAKRGTEMPGQMTLAPILTDCVAHGAQAIWSPENGAHGNLRVA